MIDHADTTQMYNVYMPNLQRKGQRNLLYLSEMPSRSVNLMFSNIPHNDLMMWTFMLAIAIVGLLIIQVALKLWEMKENDDM